jgi:tetratricopeptide (TPR) repeat protein
MSVLVDGHSVVVRNATLEQHYPGGLACYREDCPNATFCADELLSRVGFMMPDDAAVFAASLAGQWLAPARLSAGEEVAVVDGFHLTQRPCTWLQLGRWGQVPIGWLKGTRRGDLHAPAAWNAGRTLRHMSPAEAREQLEYVGLQDGVEVYRHKVTGETLYVGRTARVTESEWERHNQAYQQACQLIDGLILLDDRPPAPLDTRARERLSRALALLAEVVQINPQNWAAMWQMGKIHQRLGDRERCLQWFARAHLVNPQQHDVAREASIAAMELGRAAEAVRYCERAVQIQPDNPGLLANLGLALLLAGKPADAQARLHLAHSRNPTDPITADLLHIVQEVLAGSRPCPRSVADLR